MKLIIDIPKEEIKLYQAYGQINSHRIMSYIANGIVLPEHHGRLIDVDALNEQVIPAIKKDDVIYVKLSALQDLIDNAPTILEGTVKE